jgi:hypothetical protein
MKYLALFLLTCFLDYGWGLYIAAVSNKQEIRASIYSAIIFVSGMAVTVFTVEDHFAILPGVAGTVLGTYFSVKLHKKS